MSIAPRDLAVRLAALSKSTDAVDLGARDEDGCPEHAAAAHRSSNGYSEEWLDRLEPNGNIPKDGSLHRGQRSGQGGEGGVRWERDKPRGGGRFYIGDTVCSRRRTVARCQLPLC